MVINTKAGEVELTEKVSAVKKFNLRSAESFLAKVQAEVEQMKLNSEKERSEWNNAFAVFETQIPKTLTPEVKRVLKNGLIRIKLLKKPEKTWDLLQEIYCALNCTVDNLEKSHS